MYLGLFAKFPSRGRGLFRNLEFANPGILSLPGYDQDVLNVLIKRVIRIPRTSAQASRTPGRDTTSGKGEGGRVTTSGGTF